MKTAGRNFGLALILVGAMVIGDTAYQLHQWRLAHPGGETFAFTAGFIVFQELLLFGGFAWFAFSIRRTAAPLPIRFAYLTVLLLYVASTVVTLLLFNFLILPFFAASRIYFGALFGRTALSLLFVGLIYVACRGQREGQETRNRIEDMVAACDRIRALCGIRGWKIASGCAGLGEQIRFSEGLRLNGSLADEIARKLNQLESLAQGADNGNEPVQVSELVRELSVMTTRRS